MKEPEKRVLSIDFDYFQNAPLHTVKQIFPDGIDLTTELSEITWGIRYAFFEKQMNQVSIRKEELSMLKDILSIQKDSIPVIIANSHAGIYDFVHEQVPFSERLLMYNIDMHHDMYNNNPVPDCGNWGGFLEKEYSYGLRWFCNPISKPMYGLVRNQYTESKVDEMIPESLSTLQEGKHKKFDAIYLCRSDNWSAPHLDIYFTELCDLIQQRFCNLQMEQGIDIPRKQYLAIAEEIKTEYQEQYKNKKPNLNELRQIESDYAKDCNIIFSNVVILNSPKKVKAERGIGYE